MSEDSALLQKSRRLSQPADLYMLHFIDLERYPLARCLNGTPGNYYTLRSTNPASRNKWHIHLQGGGWCNPSSATPKDIRIGTPSYAGVDSCYWRKFQSSLGGSGKAAPNFTSEAAAKDFDTLLSTDKEVNPMLYDWNHALLRYCDGGSYSGTREDVAEVWGTQVHFKGAFILEAFHDTLSKRFNLDAATDVVFSGCSAGGLAVFLQLDRWRRLLPKSAFVAGVPDSGFFLDWHGPSGQTSQNTWASQGRVMFDAFKLRDGVNQRCVKATPEDTARCFFAQHVAKFVATPMFISQSLHDAWQLPQILAEETDYPLVDQYAATMRRLLLGLGWTNRSARSGRHAGRGGMVDSCYHHCFKWALEVDGVRRIDALGTWYAEQRAAYFENAAAPGRTEWQVYPWANTSQCCNATSLTCMR